VFYGCANVITKRRAWRDR